MKHKIGDTVQNKKPIHFGGAESIEAGSYGEVKGIFPDGWLGIHWLEAKRFWAVHPDEIEPVDELEYLTD